MKNCRELRHPDFEIRERQDGLSGKLLLTAKHQSGLQVSLLDYPGFSRAFCAAAIPFGSIHTSFSIDQKQYSLPAGTAHFLEHCVFSRDEDGGLMGRLSDLGASANAYTTHDHTLYYFSVAGPFETAFTCWLDALLTLQIDHDRVEAERPIILAEIDQYRDDPETRCSQKLLEQMYRTHPVRLDIAGTKESIRDLTEQDIQLAWETFYSPGHIHLTLAGDLDCHSILTILAERLAAYPSGIKDVRHSFPEDASRPTSEEAIEQMDLRTPLFLLGLKELDSQQTPWERAFRQRSAHLLLDCLLSSVSPLYDELYQHGLINESFSAQYLNGPGYSLLLCGGESPDPHQAADVIRKRLLEARVEDLDLELFESQKRAAAGRMIQTLDSVEHGGLMQARARLFGLDLFDYQLIYDKIDAAAVFNVFKHLSNPDYYALSIVNPRR